MEQFVNQVILRGTVAAAPEFSHENHGHRFFRFLLAVPRLSGAVDTLPVVAEEQVLPTSPLSGGESVTACGQLRSHNIRTDGKRHLLIFLFALRLTPEDGEAVNSVTLEGSVCREPTLRRTPLGREICDIMLSVPRSFQRSDYLPCIAWGKTAQEVSACRAGDLLRLEGRLQSRCYTKLTESGPEERVAYEVSALAAGPVLG